MTAVYHCMFVCVLVSMNKCMQWWVFESIGSFYRWSIVNGKYSVRMKEEMLERMLVSRFGNGWLTDRKIFHPDSDTLCNGRGSVRFGSVRAERIM